MSDTEDLKAQVVELLAMNDSLQALAVALFRHHPERPLVLQYFKHLQSVMAARELLESISDEFLEARARQHAHLLKMLETLGYS